MQRQKVVRYHRAPGPLRIDHPYLTFHDGNAVIAYGHGNLGEPGVIMKTYGMDIEEVCRKYGFRIYTSKPGGVTGNNKIKGIPIKDLYT